MLIRNTLLYLPAQLIGPATQFLAILVFTHWMAPEPYGVLTYVFASQEFVFFLCIAWWSQYTVRYFGDHAVRDDHRYRNSEGVILAGTALAMVAATLFALWLLSSPISVTLATASVLFMLTRCVNVHLGERARAQNRILDYTIAATVGPFAGFVVAFFVVVLVAATPAAVLFGYAAAQSLTLGWLMARQDLALVLRAPDRALLRQALTFGVPLIAAGVAAWFGMNAIRVAVDRDMGAAVMGLIAVGWSLGHRLTSTVSTLMTVAAFPIAVERFRDGSRDQAFDQIIDNGVLMLGIVLPSAVGLYLIQGAVIPLVVAGPFQAMTSAVLPAALIAGVARNIRTHVVDQIFILVERTSMVCKMTIIEALLVIAGCAIGLGLGGAVGAALGSATGYVLAMLVAFMVAHFDLGVDLPFEDIAHVAIATLAMVIAVSVVGTESARPGGVIGGLGLRILVGGVAYTAAILVLFPALTRAALARWTHARPSRSQPRSWKKS